MFIAALFTTDGMQEQPTRPLMDEWRNRMRHVQTLEYYPTWESKEIVPRTISWMNLEDIRVSEGSQSQRDK